MKNILLVASLFSAAAYAGADAMVIVRESDHLVKVTATENGSGVVTDFINSVGTKVIQSTSGDMIVDCSALKSCVLTFARSSGVEIGSVDSRMLVRGYLEEAAVGQLSFQTPVYLDLQNESGQVLSVRLGSTHVTATVLQ